MNIFSLLCNYQNQKITVIANDMTMFSNDYFMNYLSKNFCLAEVKDLLLNHNIISYSFDIASNTLSIVL